MINLCVATVDLISTKSAYNTGWGSINYSLFNGGPMSDHYPWVRNHAFNKWAAMVVQVGHHHQSDTCDDCGPHPSGRVILGDEADHY